MKTICRVDLSRTFADRDLGEQKALETYKGHINVISNCTMVCKIMLPISKANECLAFRLNDGTSLKSLA